MKEGFFNYLSENYPEAVLLEGLNDGIVGVDTDGHVVYSYNKCCELIMKSNGISMEEAREWVDFNTIRAIPYMGDNKPIMMYDLEDFDF